jgi:glycerophosphoryl diester phosphodiesterase
MAGREHVRLAPRSSLMGILTDAGARPVIAHRGASGQLPENTLAAFRRAIELGADAIEFDVRLTRDGVPVVIHDPTVDRTTNGSGPVHSFTLAELRQLDAGARFTLDGRTFPFRGRGWTPPTLEEVLIAFPGVPLLIELKLAAPGEGVRRVLAADGCRRRVLLGSTRAEAVAPFRKEGFATAASVREARWLGRAGLAGGADQPRYAALCIPRWFNGLPVPVTRLARLANEAGAVTHVWTVNDAATAERLWQAGIHGMITDDPAAMVAARAALAGTGAGVLSAAPRPGER